MAAQAAEVVVTAEAKSADADPAPVTAVDDAREKKRAEIMARVALAKQEREKQESQKAAFFGEHPGISCDGCGAKAPLIGYRYHCSKCANHDVCESCFDLWAGGSGVIANNLAEQRLSNDPADHMFKPWKDKSFKPLVKAAGGGSMTMPSSKKPKPNEPCSCGSGKKYKKCCSRK
mmetsp:Transcript_51160/g.69665  ORF Transcript_51160/g.69665 Transcript_51160/m.69665 type:complete len:175 (-) Transcript_51160:118-642(-)|eukprot:CAMPEP_0185744382 /NCGR_PEP_ID=MMETSP1174-20130828/2447_1 /TAXON_ID=35687 /ORGANISM="Dictyocha speculum, Strain CCMP1381" /LENGTH=174 /DNA_ID=CAMNT_0028417725 /DNA_START=64 /DNA_END=588 /DNA_ORIENTATION=+